MSKRPPTETVSREAESSKTTWTFTSIDIPPATETLVTSKRAGKVVRTPPAGSLIR